MQFPVNIIDAVLPKIVTEMDSFRSYLFIKTLDNRPGFHSPLSEKLSCPGIFGFFKMIDHFSRKGYSIGLPLVQFIDGL